MKHKIPIGRTISIVIALVLIYFGIRMLQESQQYYGKFHQWQKAEPVRLKADLSKRGSYSAPFVQTCSISHGESLYVEAGKTFSSNDEAIALIKGMKGKLWIIDPNDEKIVNMNFTDTDFELWWHKANSPVPELWIPALPNGKYTLHLTIEEPAKALANIKHILVGRYVLCGCALAPAFIMRVIGCVFTGISLIIGVVIIIKTRKHKKSTLTS